MAARFWVGGTGTWDASDTTHWAASSGGAGGQSVPGSGDTVTFDGSSGGGTVTLGYDPTITSITMGAFTGTFDAGNRSPTMGTFNCSGTGTRSFIGGNGTWTITGNNGTVWNTSTATNLTFSGSNMTVVFSYSGSTGTRTVANNGSGRLIGTVKVTAGTDTFTTSLETFNANNLDFTGFAGTWSGTTGINLAGYLTLSSGMTRTYTGGITMSATSGTNIITTNGIALDSGMTFNGVGGTWQFADSFTNASTRTLTLTNGTLDTNGQTCSWGLFSSSNSNTRVLTLGASSVTLTGTGTVWNTLSTTNLTFNCGTSSIRVSYTSTTTFEGGGLTYYNVRFDYLMGIGLTINGNNTFNNLEFIGTTGSATTQMAPFVGGNWTINGTFTATGVSSIIRICFLSSVTGTIRTISAAAVSLSGCDFMDIAGSGAAAPFTGTSIGDLGGNSGITFTPSVTRYAVAAGNWSSTSTWSSTDGGASGASVPLPQDDVYLTAASGSISVTFNMINLGKNVDFTGFTGTLAGSVGGSQSGVAAGMGIYGNLTLGSGMTITATSRYTLRGRGSQTLRTNGITIPANVGIYAFGGSYTLLDNLTLSSASTLTHNNGTFDAAGFNVTVGLFNSSNSLTRTLTMGSGTWTLTGTGNVWNFTTITGLTYNVGTSTVVISDTSASSKTIISPSSPVAFYNLTISSGGSGAVIWSGTASRSMNILTITGPKTIQWAANGTYVVANWNVQGSPGNNVVFNSTAPGTRYTFSNASGLVDVRYITIQDSLADGGAYFQATNSTDSGNNSGWNFATAAAPTSLSAGKKFARFGGARAINKVLDSKLHGYRKLGG